MTLIVVLMVYISVYMPHVTHTKTTEKAIKKAVIEKDNCLIL